MGIMREKSIKSGAKSADCRGDDRVPNRGDNRVPDRQPKSGRLLGAMLWGKKCKIFFIFVC